MISHLGLHSYKSFFLALLLMLFCAHNIYAELLFCGIGYRGEFSHIDPQSGIIEPKRNDLPDNLQALDTAPDGTLYAGYSSTLYEIDPWTGNYSNQRYLNFSVDIRAMAFSSSGDLFISSHWMLHSPQKLYSYDFHSDSRTYIGDLWGDSQASQGMAFSPDGVLYGITPDSENSTSTKSAYKLFTIDLDDAQTHLVGGGWIPRDFGGQSLNQSITFTPDGKLYAIGDSRFAELDPLDGSIIGDVTVLEDCWSNDFRGLALVPEPTTLSLLCLGIVLLKRKRV